jgi:hypothetical protein
MLSEMTILGFISLIMFVATLGDPLDDLSVDIFGSGERYYIADLIDDVQGYVMWVMVMTIAHTLLLLQVKQSVEVTQVEFNDTIVTNEEKLKKSLRGIDDLPVVTVWSWMGDYLCNPIAAYDKHRHCQSVENLAIFHSLRKEHILHRNDKSNFEEISSSRDRDGDGEVEASPDAEKRLPKDFDFAMYLSVSLSNFMAQVASFTPWSWACLWVYLIVVFAVLVGVASTSYQYYIILAAVLLAFDYADMILAYVMLNHIQESIEMLANPAHLRLSALEQQELMGDNEEDYNSAHDLDLRFPTKVNPNHTSFVYRMKHSGLQLPTAYSSDRAQSQSWFSQLIVGDHDLNKHESLLWGDKMAPTLFVFLVRMHILFVDVTFPMAFGLMVPYLFLEYGVTAGVIYIVLLILPYFVLIFYLYPNILHRLPYVLFSGQMRDLLTQNEMLRVLKMNKVFRLMIALTKISNAEKKNNLGSGFGDRDYDVNDPNVQAEITQVEKIFDEYVQSVGSGTYCVFCLVPLNLLSMSCFFGYRHG